MAEIVKIKRVTDPLNDEAKARLVGNVSSGSEHSSHYEDDSDSPCLSNLVNRFLEDDDDDEEDELRERGVGDSDSDEDPLASPADDAAEELVNRILASNYNDSFGNLILFHVSKAVSVIQCKGLDKWNFQRNVMAFLRGLGYNAAICKTKWESSGGLTAGTYEYIDVIRSDSGKRYIVDLDFAGEFEIARPSQHYSRVLRSLPLVFVGRVEELKLAIQAVSNAAKRSLKSRGLSLPPWRKNRYMQNKWLGPYRRTSNVVPTSRNNPSLTAAKCLCVGFNASNDMFPSTTTPKRYSIK